MIVSTVFKHEPIGLGELVEDKHSTVQGIVRFAPTRSPALKTPALSIQCPFSSASTAVNEPFIISQLQG